MPAPSEVTCVLRTPQKVHSIRRSHKDLRTQGEALVPSSEVASWFPLAPTCTMDSFKAIHSLTHLLSEAAAAGNRLDHT